MRVCGLDRKQAIGSMHYLAKNPRTGRQKSTRSKIIRGETLHDFAFRVESESLDTAEERLGKRITKVDGEKTEFAHFEIIKKEKQLADFYSWGIASQLAANGIAATRDEVLAIRDLSKDDVYVLEREGKTFVLSGEGDGRILLFSAKVYIPFVRNCQQFGGRDVFLNTDNTPVAAEFDGAILRIRAVYTKNDFPNSTFEPLRGVFPDFELWELAAGEACPAEVAREIFRGMTTMQNFSWEADATHRGLWMQMVQNANKQRTILSFDGFGPDFVVSKEYAGGKNVNDASEQIPGLQHVWNFEREGDFAEMTARQELANERVLVELPAFSAPAESNYKTRGTPFHESFSTVVMAPQEKQAIGMPFNATRMGASARGAASGGGAKVRKAGGSRDCGVKRGSGEESSAPRKRKRNNAPGPVPFSAISTFKAAIFDLDGVVMDSQPLHLKTFNKALEPLGVRIDNRAWKEKYPGVGSYAVFEDVFSRNGINASVKNYVERRAGIYYDELKKARVPEIAGFGAFRQELEANGIGVAVASGGHTNHVRESLRSAGLGKVPFVAIEQVKRGKPAPEIFLKTAKRLRVKPSECIVFEDALSGMQAAAAAGMPCVALATTLPESKLRGKAALVVMDFRDRKLKRLLAVLLAKRGKGGKGRKGGASKQKRRRSAGRRRK